MARTNVTNIAPNLDYLVANAQFPLTDSIVYNSIQYFEGDRFTGVEGVETYSTSDEIEVYEETKITGATIEEAVTEDSRYPDASKITGFTASYLLDVPNVTFTINITQYDNYFLMKDKGTNDWIGLHQIDLNPKNDADIQAVLNTYSGSTGQKIFTAQELYDMSAASSGNIALVWAEDLGFAIPAIDHETNLARVDVITNSGIKEIWCFEIYN